MPLLAVILFFNKGGEDFAAELVANGTEELDWAGLCLMSCFCWGCEDYGVVEDFATVAAFWGICSFGTEALGFFIAIFFWGIAVAETSAIEEVATVPAAAESSLNFFTTASAFFCSLDRYLLFSSG